MVAISIPDHLGGMTSLPFTTAASQSRQHPQSGLGFGHGHMGIKTEENVGLGLMEGAGMMRNEHGNGGNGGNGYQDGFSHPFGSMGNVFTGMDFNPMNANQGQGGRNNSGSSFDSSGVNPSALMNLGLDAHRTAQAQRMQQQHAQQQNRHQLYDNMTNGPPKRSHGQLQQPQRQNSLMNGSASAGSGISAYSELASPDSDVDGDNGGNMTGSGGESLASSMIMAAQARGFPQPKGHSMTSAHNDNHSLDIVNNAAPSEPSSGKVLTKRGPKTGKKDQAQTAEDIISGKTGKPLKPKSRKRVNTAEKRASHNAVERMRREQLNEKFLDLARLLPTLANLRRPSKSAIVNSSISHLSLQREQRLLAANELRNMHADYIELLAEVQDWRSRNGVASRGNNVEWTEAMNEICSVEAEVFGVFTGVGGTGDDNEGEGDDNEGDDNMEEEEESKDMMDLQPAMDTKRYSGVSEVDVKPFSQGSRMPASASYANRQMSFQTNASGEDAMYNNNGQGSPQGSNGAFSARSVITPPAHGAPILSNGFSTSPSSSTRPTFAAVPDADQVATWAAQQVYLQYAQAQQAKRLDNRAAFADGSGAYARHAVLDVTQQMLNVSHPHLAASVFPPPISTESPPNEGSYSGSFMTNSFAPTHSAPGTAPSLDQVEMWQKLAAGHFQGNMGRAQGQQQNMPTISQLKEALRAGMSVGMGLANGTWSNNEA